MPALVCNGEIEDELPPGLTSIDIKSLTSRTDLVGKYLNATIHHRYQLNEKPVASLKLTLKSSSGSFIDLLAIGQVAKDLDICSQGDILICLKFEVEACPGHYHRLYQIIVDDTENIGSLVWIFKKDADRNITEHRKTHQLSRRNYTYKPLSEVEVNTTVDVYGVVKHFKRPYKTMGSDYCCVVYLTDPSFDSPDDKLSCNIFKLKEADLPQVDIGDIVRFHRLKIEEYQGKKQGCSGPGFHWLIFHGTVTECQASSSSYTFEQEDKDRVTSLLEWWRMQTTTRTKKLCEIRANDYFDLICQVIRNCDLKDKACRVCRAWDGTKFDGPLKMLQEAEFNDTVEEDDILIKASSGLAVDLYIFDNHVQSAKIIKPGSFIQLSNLHAALVSGTVELTLHGGTWFNRGVQLLSEDSPQVTQLKAVLGPLILKKTACNLSEQENNTVESRHGIDTASYAESIKTGKDNNTASSDTALKESSSVKKHNQFNDYNKLSHMPLNVNRSSPCGEGGNFVEELVVVNCREKVNVAEKPRQILNHDEPGTETVVSVVEKTSNGNQEQYALELLDISDSTGQSVWVSANDDSDIENEMQHRKVGHDELQDCNISLSWASSHGFPYGQNANTEGGADRDKLQVFSVELHDNIVLSSQESFYTGSSQRSTSNVTHSTAETRQTERIVLSLKNMSDMQEKLDDNHAVSSFDIYSLDSSTQHFDTVKFTEVNPALNSASTQESEAVSSPSFQHPAFQQSDCENLHSELLEPFNHMTNSAGSALSCEGSQQLRCMLKTASVVIGHLHVPPSSVKDVLDHAAPHKFKVLVRVQNLMPKPTTPADLVSFCCSRCYHREPASSVQTPWDTGLLRHTCSDGVIQTVELKPTFILTFQLTDGKHSLQAYLWDKFAIQFFCGINPLDILTNGRNFQQVQEWIDSLCPVNSCLFDRPLLECCLLSYNVGGSVKYQIFDTVLV